MGKGWGGVVLKEYCHVVLYLSGVTLWSVPFVTSFMLLMPK